MIAGVPAAEHADRPDRSAQPERFLGNVPEELMWNQTDPPAFNAAIAEEVAAHPTYHVVDVDFLYGKLLDGKVSQGGTILEKDQVFSDPLHITALGHQLTAEFFISRINEVYPGIAIPSVLEIVILD